MGIYKQVAGGKEERRGRVIGRANDRTAGWEVKQGGAGAVTSKNLLVVGEGRSMILVAGISHLLVCLSKPPPSSRTFRESLLLNIPTLVRISSDNSRPDFSKYFVTTRQICIQISVSAVFVVSMGWQKILRNKLNITGS